MVTPSCQLGLGYKVIFFVLYVKSSIYSTKTDVSEEATAPLEIKYPTDDNFSDWSHYFPLLHSS